MSDDLVPGARVRILDDDLAMCAHVAADRLQALADYFRAQPPGTVLLRIALVLHDGEPVFETDIGRPIPVDPREVPDVARN